MSHQRRASWLIAYEGKLQLRDSVGFAPNFPRYLQKLLPSGTAAESSVAQRPPFSLAIAGSCVRLGKKTMDKTALLALLAGQNRGLGTSKEFQQQVAQAIAQVEALNPTPDPLAQPDLLAGDWRLVYTTSNSLLNLDRLPGASLGAIYQSIRPQEQQIYNLAELNSWPYLHGLVAVVAKYQPLNQRRVQVSFERSIIGWQGLMDYHGPAPWIDRLHGGPKFPALDLAIKNPRTDSWLEVTYLDRSLRIGRGNQGNVFVLVKD